MPLFIKKEELNRVIRSSVKESVRQEIQALLDDNEFSHLVSVKYLSKLSSRELKNYFNAIELYRQAEDKLSKIDVSGEVSDDLEEEDNGLYDTTLSNPGDLDEDVLNEFLEDSSTKTVNISKKKD